MPAAPPDPSRRPPADAPDPRAGARSGQSEEPAYDPLKELKAAGTNLSEIATYAQQLVAAKVAGGLYAVRKLAILAVLGLVGGIAGASIVVTASAMLVFGLAEIIAAFLPEQFKWAGKVIVGLLVLGVTFAGLWLLLRFSVKAGKDTALRQYRLSLKKQRLDHGHDAFGRAAAAAAGSAEAVRRSPARTKEQQAALREKKARAERDQRQIDEDFARLTNK